MTTETDEKLADNTDLIERVANSTLSAIEFQLSKTEADIIAKAAIKETLDYLVESEWEMTFQSPEDLEASRLGIGKVEAMLKQMRTEVIGESG